MVDTVDFSKNIVRLERIKKMTYNLDTIGLSANVIKNTVVELAKFKEGDFYPKHAISNLVECVNNIGKGNSLSFVDTDSDDHNQWRTYTLDIYDDGVVKISSYNTAHSDEASKKVVIIEPIRFMTADERRIFDSFVYRAILSIHDNRFELNKKELRAFYDMISHMPKENLNFYAYQIKSEWGRILIADNHQGEKNVYEREVEMFGD